MPTVDAGNKPTLDSKFAARDVEALKRIVARYRPSLVRRACTRMPDTPPDICEEAVQELLLSLWDRGADDYDAARGSMKAYLTARLRTTMRQVRTKYTPPGERTRRARASCDEISLTAQESTHASMPTFDDNGEVVNTDEMLSEPSSGEWSARIDDEIDAEAIMARAEKDRLDDVLARIHRDEDSLVKVAHETAIARTTLDYRLRKFYEAERAAA